MTTVAERRELARTVIETYQMSERRACALLNLSRTAYRYQAQKSDDQAIQEQLLALASKKLRWGFPKMFAYLRNQGYKWNHKRVRCIHRELGLNLRIKPRKRLPKRDPQPLEAPVVANYSWSLDFMHDSLAIGRTIRTLNIIDDFSSRRLVDRSGHLHSVRQGDPGVGDAGIMAWVS